MQPSNQNPLSQNTNSSSLDHALKNAPLEDKLWLFFKKYQNYFYLLLILLTTSLLGYKALQFYKQNQLERLQFEYREAADEKQELAFAERNPKEPLAGFVFLNYADKKNSNKAYSDAIQLYDKSLLGLQSSPLKYRALLSKALCLILNNNKAQGSTILEQLLNDKSTLSIIAAEAAYNLALLSLQDKQPQKSLQFLDAIPKLPYSGIWLEKAEFLKKMIPNPSK